MKAFVALFFLAMLMGGCARSQNVWPMLDDQDNLATIERNKSVMALPEAPK